MLNNKMKIKYWRRFLVQYDLILIKNPFILVQWEHTVGTDMKSHFTSTSLSLKLFQSSHGSVHTLLALNLEFYIPFSAGDPTGFRFFFHRRLIGAARTCRWLTRTRRWLILRAWDTVMTIVRFNSKSVRNASVVTQDVSPSIHTQHTLVLNSVGHRSSVRIRGEIFLAHELLQVGVQRNFIRYR